MKRILFILSIIFITCTTGFAQVGNGQNLQIDILIGTTSNSGFVMGLAFKDMYNGFGLFYHTDGVGTAYTGSTGINYGSISDRTEITDYGLSENNTYGMSFGITYNLSKILRKDNSGLTIFLGTGYAVKEDVYERYEYYVWDCCPELNEGNLITWISDSNTVPIIEILLGYDFIKDGTFEFNLTGGYVSTHGLLGMVGVGFSL